MSRDRCHVTLLSTVQKNPVTTMLTYPWKCTVLHCNHLENTWKPMVLMTRHFDYCPSTSEGDNQSVGSSAPVVSRCFPGGYNVKLYISRGRLAWWLLAFLCCVPCWAHSSLCCIYPTSPNIVHCVFSMMEHACSVCYARPNEMQCQLQWEEYRDNGLRQGVTSIFFHGISDVMQTILQSIRKQQ